MSRLAYLLPALMISLSACSDKADDDDDDDDDDSGRPGWADGGDGLYGGGDGGDGGDSGDGGDGGSSTPRPVEGTWTVTGTELLADPCGLAAFQDPAELIPATLGVSHEGSSAFRVTGDGGDPSSCTAEASGAYQCSSSSTEQTLGDFGIDATLVIDNHLAGSTSADGLDWQVTTFVEISCVGGNCDLLASLGLAFPCSQELGLGTAAP